MTRQKFDSGNFSDSVSVIAPKRYQSGLEAANTKEFTVPDGEVWRILWSYFKITSDGTAGNRRGHLKIEDSSGDVIFLHLSAATQAASSDRSYNFMPGCARDSAFAGDIITIPIPMVCDVEPGSVITIGDYANISASDEVTYSLVVEVYHI